MTSPVETVQQTESVELAWEKMRARRIHHLVVMDGERMVGVLSNRDVGGTHREPLRGAVSVAERMSAPIVSADLKTTVREAANLLRGHVIGCLPVTEKGQLVGMVTVSDLLDLIGRGAERPIAKADRKSLHKRGPRRTPPHEHA